jgi:hypothetical protein
VASTGITGAAGPASTVDQRQAWLRVARVHLRTGMLALARTELESAAGAGTLDLAGLLDLAEVRWRTGDLPGAGDAAGAYLASEEGEDDVLACVIAAEAAAGLGRPEDARRLSSRAVELATVPIDAIFAGLPTRASWPAETLELHVPNHAITVSGTSDEDAAPLPLDRPGLWDGDPFVAGPVTPDPEAHLVAGRMALASGDHARAALHLGLVLRLGPPLAPAVLEAVGDPVGPDLALVRGDALRLVGQEWEARRAFVAAAAGLHASAAASAPRGSASVSAGDATPVRETPIGRPGPDADPDAAPDADPDAAPDADPDAAPDADPDAAPDRSGEPPPA